MQQAGFEGPESPQDPEAAYAQSELRGRVQRGLLEIAPKLRLPLVLYDLEGLAYPEIARLLELPEGTVKSRIHRARELLREALVADGAIGRSQS